MESENDFFLNLDSPIVRENEDEGENDNDEGAREEYYKEEIANQLIQERRDIEMIPIGLNNLNLPNEWFTPEGISLEEIARKNPYFFLKEKQTILNEIKEEDFEYNPWSDHVFLRNVFCIDEYRKKHNGEVYLYSIDLFHQIFTLYQHPLCLIETMDYLGPLSRVSETMKQIQKMKKKYKRHKKNTTDEEEENYGYDDSAIIFDDKDSEKCVDKILSSTTFYKKRVIEDIINDEEFKRFSKDLNGETNHFSISKLNPKKHENFALAMLFLYWLPYIVSIWLDNKWCAKGVFYKNTQLENEQKLKARGYVGRMSNYESILLFTMITGRFVENKNFQPPVSRAGSDFHDFVLNEKLGMHFGKWCFKLMNALPPELRSKKVCYSVRGVKIIANVVEPIYFKNLRNNKTLKEGSIIKDFFREDGVFDLDSCANRLRPDRYKTKPANISTDIAVKLEEEIKKSDPTIFDEEINKKTLREANEQRISGLSSYLHPNSDNETNVIIKNNSKNNDKKMTIKVVKKVNGFEEEFKEINDKKTLVIKKKVEDGAGDDDDDDEDEKTEKISKNSKKITKIQKQKKNVSERLENLEKSMSTFQDTVINALKIIFDKLKS